MSYGSGTKRAYRSRKKVCKEHSNGRERCHRRSSFLLHSDFCLFFLFLRFDQPAVFYGWVRPILYCIAPAMCAVFLIAAFWLTSSYRLNLALALCATFGSLYLAEIGVIMVSEGARSFFAKAHAFDTRGTLEVINQLNRQAPMLFLTSLRPCCSSAALVSLVNHPSRLLGRRCCHWEALRTH